MPGCFVFQVDLTEPQYAVVAECLPANGGELFCSLAIVPVAMLALKPRMAVKGLTANPTAAKAP